MRHDSGDEKEYPDADQGIYDLRPTARGEEEHLREVGGGKRHGDPNTLFRVVIGGKDDRDVEEVGEDDEYPEGETVCSDAERNQRRCNDAEEG